MRDRLKRLVPVLSASIGQDRDILDPGPRWRIDARFLALLISNHLNFDFIRKNRRVEPEKGVNAYSAAHGRVKQGPIKAGNPSVLDILA